MSDVNFKSKYPSDATNGYGSMPAEQISESETDSYNAQDIDIADAEIVLGSIQEEPQEEPCSHKRPIGLVLLWSALAIAAFVALAPVWGFLVFSFALSTEDEFTTLPSPSGKHELRVHSLPAFGFGSHGIIVRVQEGRKTLAEYKTSLHNDGANLGDHNIQAHWQNDGLAHICLRGQEQNAEGIVVTLTPQDRLSQTEVVFSASLEPCLP